MWKIARLFMLLLPVFFTGCNNEIYLRDGVTDGDTFMINPHAAGSPDPVVQSWIRYSLTRSVCQLELTDRNPARATSYDCELRSRRQLAGAWIEHTSNDPDLRDDYLDDLRFVYRAGYLREYVADNFARRGWDLPDDLNRGAYYRWRRDELRGHHPETRIIGSWSYRRRTPANN